MRRVVYCETSDLTAMRLHVALTYQLPRSDLRKLIRRQEYTALVRLDSV